MRCSKRRRNHFAGGRLLDWFVSRGDEMSVAGGAVRSGHEHGPSAGTPTTLSDLIKFCALAAALAIFADASIAHAMLWENDPYWTYWVTDTLLMATVFSVGTALMGVGRVQGAIITVVHITLLTIYYWSLSPIGLPASPEWLDFKHTWATGLPVHLGVYYLGYLTALWLWRRRLAAGADRDNLVRVAIAAVVTAVIVVVGTGAVQTLITGEFPGLTWFVMRIAVTVPFLLGWWRLAGTDDKAALVGGVALALLLTTYAHYLGPIGLPNPARLVTEISPGAESHWLSYRLAFLVLLPAMLVVTTVGLLLAGRLLRRDLTAPVQRLHLNPAEAGWSLGAVGALIVTGVLVSPMTGLDNRRATVISAGTARIPPSETQAETATLRAEVEDRNMIRTPLPPHDQVNITATIPASDGRLYRLVATRPMVAEPGGQFPTWGGVGFDVWHHGRSGIGYGDAQAVNSEVGVFALGDLSVDGSVVAAGVPVQMFTTPNDRRRLELLVGDPASPLPGVTGGGLHVVWSDYVGGAPSRGVYAREALGGAVLLLLLAFSFIGARRRRGQQTGSAAT
jgi:hypothetical protein